MNGLLFLLKELWIIKKTMKRHGHRLRRGKYYVYPSMRAMVLCDDDTKRMSDCYFGKVKRGGKAAAIVEALNKCGFFYNRVKSTEKYEAVYIANNYDAVRETKLFSFESGKVLVICVSEEERQNVLALNDRLRETYPMPSVRAVAMSCAYETSMVRVTDRPDERKAIEQIAVTTAKTGDIDLKTERLADLVSFGCDDEEETAIVQELASCISADILEMPIPFCAQHGDLSNDNLMYGEADGKEGFFWIDWEHHSERVFFYDLFFYILNTAVYSPESPVLRELLGGEYDDILTAFFAAFGLSYPAEHKRDLFLAFALVFLKERVIGLGRTAALRMYRDFLLKGVVL